MDLAPILENQMEKKMEREIQTGVIQWCIGIKLFQNQCLFGGPLLQEL